jgi:hypothetical protein
VSATWHVHVRTGAKVTICSIRGVPASACKMSLANGSFDKEQHRASRCGLEYDCSDGACGPDGC